MGIAFLLQLRESFDKIKYLKFLGFLSKSISLKFPKN